MKVNLREEKKLWRKKYQRIVGLDEAGRGPLAGPVTVCAVSLKKNLISKIYNLKFILKDSKKLTSKKRKEIYKLLINNPAIETATAKVSEKVIDRINILEATKLAMKRAVEKLKTKNKRLKVDFLILDGNFKINSDIPQKSIIKGDEKVFSCAAASIIAKVKRDNIMKEYHKRYPQYGFDRHKGYPTEFHRKMLKKYGPCKIHRKTFKPIRKMI